jgi:dihydroxy-acid dehydratase
VSRGAANAPPPRLQAVARHAGVALSIDDWQEHGHALPLLVDVQPAGRHLCEVVWRWWCGVCGRSTAYAA